ncbi:MAG: hypothetical protein M1818_003734 [Claussenomyces sp. TS43310]|nr:MAG: hypothetical protein M1818_003734 [Claussenomyces sp. TS43310]
MKHFLSFPRPTLQPRLGWHRCARSTASPTIKDWGCDRSKLLPGELKRRDGTAVTSAPILIESDEEEEDDDGDDDSSDDADTAATSLNANAGDISLHTSPSESAVSTPSKTTRPLMDTSAHNTWLSQNPPWSTCLKPSDGADDCSAKSTSLKLQEQTDQICARAVDYLQALSRQQRDPTIRSASAEPARSRTASQEPEREGSPLSNSHSSTRLVANPEQSETDDKDRLDERLLQQERPAEAMSATGENLDGPETRRRQNDREEISEDPRYIEANDSHDTNCVDLRPAKRQKLSSPLAEKAVTPASGLPSPLPVTQSEVDNAHHRTNLEHLPTTAVDAHPCIPQAITQRWPFQGSLQCTMNGN